MEWWEEMISWRALYFCGGPIYLWPPAQICDTHTVCNSCLYQIFFSPCAKEFLFYAKFSISINNFISSWVFYLSSAGYTGTACHVMWVYFELITSHFPFCMWHLVYLLCPFWLLLYSFSLCFLFCSLIFFFFSSCVGKEFRVRNGEDFGRTQSYWKKFNSLMWTCVARKWCDGSSPLSFECLCILDDVQPCRWVIVFGNYIVQ